MNGHPFRQLVARSGSEGTTLVNARGESLKVSLEHNQAGLLAPADQPFGTSDQDYIYESGDGVSLAGNDSEIPSGIHKVEGIEFIRGVVSRSETYSVQVEFLDGGFSALHAESPLSSVTGSNVWEVKAYSPKFRIRYKDASGNSATFTYKEYAN